MINTILSSFTGHRSEAVRVYKRTSDEQKATVSDILSVGPVPDKKRRIDATASPEPEPDVVADGGKCDERKYSVTINFN